MENQTYTITTADIQQLADHMGGYLDFLLMAVAFSFFILGCLSGSFFRHRYEKRQWLKNGIYCDDCCPIVDQAKEGNS